MGHQHHREHTPAWLVGKRVETHGMSQASMNGKRGVATHFHMLRKEDPSTWDYTVELDGGGLPKLKWANVRAELAAAAMPDEASTPTLKTATAIKSETELLPSKKFVYLIQGPSHWEDPRLKTNEDRDVLWLSYTTFPSNRSDVVYLPGSTWTEGRNALLDFALHRANMTSGAGYEYYTFLDQDFLSMIVGDDPWASWEEGLLSELPAIGYAVRSMPWQLSMSHVLPGETCVRSVFNVDAICQAFHRTTLGLALPYDVWGDDKSIYFSAYISNMEVAAFYPHSRVGYFDVQVNLDRNQHNKNNARRQHRRLAYIRSVEWRMCKQYMRGAFLDPALVVAVDRGNCGSLKTDEYCEHQACPGRFNRTGPVDSKWMKKYLETKHPWASKKLAFIRKWETFLKRSRTPFVRESHDCSGRSTSGARCLA
jgi:hypothetical protein